MDFWKDRPAGWLAHPKHIAARWPALALKPLLWAELGAQRDRDLVCTVLADLDPAVHVHPYAFGGVLLERARQRAAAAPDDESRAAFQALAQKISSHLHLVDDLWRRWRYAADRRPVAVTISGDHAAAPVEPAGEFGIILALLPDEQGRRTQAAQARESAPRPAAAGPSVNSTGGLSKDG